MRLRHLTLNNYCQHEKLEVSFDAPVIGIVGRNGAGKTNLTRAVKFALQGAKVERIGKAKDDLRWGAESGSVDLDFSLHGIDGKLRRSLTSSTCSLSYGTERHKSAEAVERRMVDLLGVEPRVLADVVFVAQDEVNRILFQPASERKEAFYHLTGVIRAERLRELLTDRLTSLSDASVGDELAVARSRWEEAQKSAAVRERQVNELAAGLLMPPQVAELRKMLDDTRRAAQTLGRRSQLTAEVERLAGAAELAQGRWAAAEHRLPLLEAEVQRLRAGAGSAEDTIRAGLAAKEAEAARAGLLRNLEDAQRRAAAPAPKERAEDFDEELAICAQALAELQPRVKSAKALLQARQLGAAGRCPTCAQLIPAEAVAFAQATLAKDEPQLQFFEKSQAEKRVLQRQTGAVYTSWQLNVQNAQQEVRNYGASLAKLAAPADVNQQAVAAAKEVLRLLEEANGNVGLARQDLAHSAEVLETNKAVLAQSQAELADCVELLKGLQVATEAQQREAELALAKWQQVEMQLAGLRGELAAMKRTLDNLAEDYKRLAEHEKSLAVQRKFKELLDKARLVLHKDNLPRVAAGRYLEALNGGLAKYLGKFYVPFTAEITEELEVAYRLSDGEPRPVSRLSGGQKVALSLAFRFAVHELFASSVGLMILDEPTNDLDTDAVERLVQLLNMVRGWAASSGMQLIVVTHEDRLCPAFDKTIRLC